MLLDIFFISGIGITVFMVFLLLSKKEKSTPDKVLTLWLATISAHLFLFYLHYSEKIFQYPNLIGIAIPLPLLHGVFLYLYVAAMTNQLPQKKWTAFLHFTPTVLAFLYLVPFFLKTDTYKIEVFRNNGAGYELFSLIMLMAVSVSGVIYVVWCSFLLKKHRHNIEDQFSDIEKINLQWLQFMTIGMLVIWMLVIFIEGGVFTFCGVVIYVFLMGYFGVRQVGVFTDNRTLSTVEIESRENMSEEISQEKNFIEEKKARELPKEKYSKSGLTEEKAEELFHKLSLLMKEQEVYKQGELTIGELAQTLDIHSNYLSQVINEKQGCNFYEYVNNYRVEEFKRLSSLPQSKNMTLLALAFDCGFNSKSSFNRYFKKVTGVTPTAYINSLAETEAG